MSTKEWLGRGKGRVAFFFVLLARPEKLRLLIFGGMRECERPYMIKLRRSVKNTFGACPRSVW